MRVRAAGTAILLALCGAAGARAELRELRPGFNLFTPQQDIQLGREAVGEVERQAQVVRNPELERYLNVLLRKLEQSRYARTLNDDGSRAAMFPFQIRVLADKNINAFSLPGGPIFVNTAAVAAAENEAQLAGVIAHEMSHIVLRHPTNQASKRNLVALPALLASVLAGNSLLGQLAQIGIGFTLNSALLKFSRTDEQEADYNGAEILADAGYNPMELARFFERLETKTQQGTLIQFLSDHPNPGNRAEAIAQEMRDLPRRKYMADETGQFAKVHELARQVRPVATARGEIREPERPDSELRTYHGRTFSVEYPGNWQAHASGNGDAVTIAPLEGLVAGAGGNVAIGYGMEINYYIPQGQSAELQRDTEALIRKLERDNTGMRTSREARSIQVAGQAALLSTLNSQSPYGGEREVDVLVTVVRPEGLFYVVFIAPEREFGRAQPLFEKVVTSIKFE